MEKEVGESEERAPGLWGFLAGGGCQRCQESMVGSVPGEHGRVQCQESTVGFSIQLKLGAWLYYDRIQNRFEFQGVSSIFQRVMPF